MYTITTLKLDLCASVMEGQQKQFDLELHDTLSLATECEVCPFTVQFITLYIV